jgi:flagellar biosynthesis protein FliP
MSDWLQFEFWTELAKAEPSLSHLDDVGREISESIQSAESAFVSALKIAPDSLVMLQKYSRFLLEVTLARRALNVMC